MTNTTENMHAVVIGKRVALGTPRNDDYYDDGRTETDALHGHFLRRRES